MVDKKLFTAIATLTGTVIGAGFLGIPYVIAKSGFLIGTVHMIIICIMMMLINLALGEIILSSKKQQQLPGYVSKYLGKKTKIIVFIASLIGFYAALLAYIIGQGQSISFILFNSTNHAFAISIIFWILMALITFKGIKEFKKIEPLGVAGIFLVTLILGIINFNKISITNLATTNPSFLFLPFGVTLFAFLGVSSIPEIKRVLQKNTKLMKKSIIIGSLIPLVVYLIFTAVVIGLHGNAIAQVAAISLGKIITLLGILTMFTAFLALSLALQDTYRFDFGLKFKSAWLLGIAIPLILFIPISLFNLAGFVKVLSIGGSVAGGLLGISILLAHEHLKNQKLERKPEYKINIPLMIKIVFIVLFVVGIIYEFL